MLGIVSGLVFERVQSTNTRCEYHTNVVAVGVAVQQLAVVDGLLGCGDGILRVQVGALDILQLAAVAGVEQIVGHVETLDLAGKLRLEQRGIKMCDRSRATHTRQRILPCCVDIQADGRDGSKTRHHYSL